MSLNDLNKDELEKIADEFALDTDLEEDELRAEVAKLSKAEVALSFPELADRLEDDEEDEDEEVALVTSETTPKKGTAKKAAKKTTAKKATTKTAEATPVKSKTVVPDDRTLLKMTRNNPVYEVRGYRFTRQMPYVFVKTEDVDFLIEVEGGFAVAKPTEVEAFFN
jgi:DNA gyrase/topoisomerase IV subunit A